MKVIEVLEEMILLLWNSGMDIESGYVLTMPENIYENMMTESFNEIPKDAIIENIRIAEHFEFILRIGDELSIKKFVVKTG